MTGGHGTLLLGLGLSPPHHSLTHGVSEESGKMKKVVSAIPCEYGENARGMDSRVDVWPRFNGVALWKGPGRGGRDAGEFRRKDVNVPGSGHGVVVFMKC